MIPQMADFASQFEVETNRTSIKSMEKYKLEDTSQMPKREKLRFPSVWENVGVPYLTIDFFPKIIHFSTLNSQFISATKPSDRTAFGHLNDKYPKITEELVKRWRENVGPPFTFDFLVFIELLNSTIKYGKISNIEPEKDKEGKFLWFTVRFDNCDLETWREMEDEIGKIGYNLYRRFGESVVRAGRLINTECIDVFR